MIGLFSYTCTLDLTMVPVIPFFKIIIIPINFDQVKNDYIYIL